MKIKAGNREPISFKALAVIALTMFFAFERVLVSRWGILRYSDEIFALIVLGKISLMAWRKSNKYAKAETEIILLMGILLAVGLCGNGRSRILLQAVPVFTDVLSTVKIFLSYYWIRSLRLGKSQWDRIIRGLAALVRLSVAVMMLFYVASLAGVPYAEKSMLGEVRMGMRSYRFFFNNPGNFSKIFYFFIPILSADLYYRKSLSKKIFIAMGLFLWMSTLRSRAIAFALCYIVFSFCFFKIRKESYKMKPIQMMPLGAMALVLGWKQMIYYFQNESQTRHQLLKYGIITMREYFPIGAGFGTYGSDVAIQEYSMLYSRYGFEEIYGMGRVHTHFLNDNYWPMIMGQFGMIGLLLVCAILYKFYRFNLRITGENKCFYFATLLMAGFLLASSIASKSYSEYSMMPVFILHGILAQRELSSQSRK